VRTLAAYGAGLACGIALLFWLMPLDAIEGTGGLWRAPVADMAQTLTGHLALQLDAWRLPPLLARTLFWPRGVSIALTDSNPLFSLAAKLVTTLRGGGPVNLLGAWLACCWVLQPVAAVFALGALTPSLAGAVAVAVLAGLFPALLVRVGHVNLCGHFFLLLALGVTFRLLQAERPRRWVGAAAVLTGAVLCHPYLFMASAATLAAVPVQATLRRMPGWWRSWARFLLAAGAPVAAFVVLAGTLGGGDKGFVHYSMNLLSPFWPQRSGLFGPGLPVIDATGGQYEGFCYLGAGTLLLLIAGMRDASRLRRWPGLVTVLAALTLLALSSRVYAGHVKLLDLGVKPWEDIFGVFRASGRAFWPVGYALVIGAVAAACRFPAPVRLPLLAVAVVLQVIDTAPVRQSAEAALAGRIAQAPALPPVPAGATLLTVLPAPGCGASDQARALTSPLLLAGVRAGMRLGDVGVGRAPAWFSCEAVLSDALELPLRPLEVRVFTDHAAQQPLRPALLAPEARCRTDDRVVLCVRGLELQGQPVTSPPAPPPGPLAGALGWGWRVSEDGSAWSEGPRASLLLAAPGDGDVDLTLRIAGVARSPGATRHVSVSAGRLPLTGLELADGEARDVTLRIPRRAVENGTLRIAFDVYRAVDPAARGLAAPVHRAALHLSAATVRPAPLP